MKYIRFARARTRPILCAMLLLGVGDAVAAGVERQAAVVKQAGVNQVSTRLTLRWHRDGPLEVVDAVELPGFTKLERTLNRQYAWEVQLGSRVVAVQAVDVDFEERTAGADPLSPAPPLRAIQDFFVDIPGIGLDQAAQATVRVLELTDTGEETQMTIGALDRLEAAGMARLRAETQAASAVEKGRRVDRKGTAAPNDAP